MLHGLVGILLIAAVLVWIYVLAAREDYLLVMRWPGRGWFVFERVRSGRYRMIAPAALPLAFARFSSELLHRTAAVVASWAGWIRDRVRAPWAVRA